MQLCIFEDTQYANFQPLVYFRPVYDLRCGVLTMREKIALRFPRAGIALHLRKELEEYYREENPTLFINQLATADTWFVNGRVIADDALSHLIRKHDRSRDAVFCSDKQVCAAFITAQHVEAMAEHLGGPLTREAFGNLPSEEVPLRMVHYVWDIIQHATTHISDDFQMLSRMKGKRISIVPKHPGSHFLQRKNILLGKETIVHPGVVLDAERGPIIIGKGVTLMAHAYVEGPAAIDDGSTIKVGARIYHGTSIGKRCKVGGEVEASTVLSYTNKQHDGFLGHSYLGSWINIGADTNTSDLKNTYGSVKVQMDSETFDTGLQFVGLMMGDHSKTGINSMFDTGTVVGASCNIYGANLPPKFVPGFSWGDGKSFSVYDIEKSLETARRVFARRNIRMTDAYERLYRHVYSATGRSRMKAGIA